MKKPARRPEPAHSQRPLRVESLEDRRMLATFTVTSLTDAGQGTLRDAINVANVTPGEDRIEFAANLTGAINTASQLPAISESLTIAGPGADTLAIDAQELSRVLEVSDVGGGADLRIEGLTLQGGRSLESGGGILFSSEGTLTLVDSVVTGNTITGLRRRGGGISVGPNAEISLINSAVSNNDAELGYGGGIDAGANSLVTLVNSSVTNNSSFISGGGINSSVEYGVVSLTRSTVAGNTAATGGGISNHLGTITLTDSTIANNTALARGGGIDASQSRGVTTLIRSTVTGNRTTGLSARGGGIAADGDSGVRLINSTVTANTTELNSSPGGGISTRDADIELINSTVSGNGVLGDSDGGGIHTESGDVELFNSTVTNNFAGDGTGGVAIDQNFNNTLLRSQNSIVQGNTGSGAVADLRLATTTGRTIDIDFSVLGDRAGAGLANPSGFGNLLGVDPLLGPLADNGGPTLTHALLPGSPALDTGDPNFDPGDFTPRLNNDQRGVGFLRVRDADGSGPARVDIGAFEAQFVFEVSSLADTDDGDFSPGELTLREAITLANNSGTDQITFDPALFPGGLTRLDLTDQLPTITAPLTITGPGQSLLALDAGNGDDGVFGTVDGFRHFDINDGASSRITVTLSGLTLLGGDEISEGGAIRSTERLRITDSLLAFNRGSRGGAIASLDGGELTLTRSTVRDNRGSRGGGIHVDDGDLEINRSTINSNESAFNGGGIYARDTSLILEQSTVSSNRTVAVSGDGGGIYIHGDLEISRSTITRNRTFGSNTEGGGLFRANASASADIMGTILSDNEAGAVGDDYADTTQGQAPVNASGNFLGTGVPFGAGNLFSDEPKLGLLTNNGGPTQTHLPLEGSPVIDQGDLTSSTGFDQRGEPFARVFGTRVDIGAVEAQPSPLPGDYNDDNVVDLADYTVWRDQFGQIVTLPNEDPSVTPGQVTIEDYDVWRDNFGAIRPTPVVVASVTAPAPITSVEAALKDAAPAPPLQQPAFVEPEPEIDAAFAALVTPPPTGVGVSPARATRFVPAQQVSDESLLLLTLAIVEIEATPNDFATFDDAFSEEEADKPEDPETSPAALEVANGEP